MDYLQSSYCLICRNVGLIVAIIEVALNSEKQVLTET